MEQQERDFKGIWISKEVWLDRRLSALDKFILAEIDSLDGENGCYASNEYLAEFCQCSSRKVSDSISKLIGFGYIEQESFDGRRRVLRSRLSFSSMQSSNFCYADTQKMNAININEYSIIEERKKENKEKNNAQAKIDRSNSHDQVMERRGVKYGSEFYEILKEFLQMCYANGHLVTDSKLDDIILRLNKWYKDDENGKVQSVRNAISGGYFDVIELRQADGIYRY